MSEFLLEDEAYNAGIQVAARAAVKVDLIFDLESRAVAAHLQ